MKVLLINTVSTDKNGITNVIFNYLHAIDSTQIRFDYVAINQPEDTYIDEIQKKGGNLYVIPRSGKKIISYIRQLTQTISNHKYNVIHIHTNSHTAILELLAAKLGGCHNRIVHSHNTTCNSIAVHKILTPLFNALYTHAFACGVDSGKWMYGNNPFLVINNGVNTDLYSFNSDSRVKIREQLNLKEEDILIGHVGTFIPVKNQKFIIDILQILIKRNPRYNLLLIGDGPLRQQVERQVSLYNLQDHVHFTGNINNVYDYLNAIDLIIMPSLFEGLPLTLIEQQANGLHCIVADTITREADKTGYLQFVSLNDSAELWATEIEKNCNSNNREFYSIEGINKIKLAGYSIQEEGKKLTEFYKSIND